jgi:hypothetical protein
MTEPENVNSAPVAAPVVPPGFHINPSTGQREWWDGTAWSPAPSKKPVEPLALFALIAGGAAFLFGLVPILGLLLALAGAALAVVAFLKKAQPMWMSVVGIAGSAIAFLTSIIVLIAFIVGLGAPQPDPVALVPDEVATAEPVPTPTLETSPIPEPAEVDVATFKSDANRDIDDFEKDLDDMIVTVDEGGFWRLLSNTFELSFNLGQLQASPPPTSIEASWLPELDKLDASITAITDVISTDDPAKIKAAIEASRKAAEAVRNLADSAT